MNIQNVTCEFTHPPISLDCRHPRFSWEIEAQENNIFQASYQVIVRDESGNLMWDSGIQKSPDSTGIPYDGAKLRSASAYTYNISVWTNTGEAAKSVEYSFETAFFDLSDWKARWIEPDPLPQLPVNPLLTARQEWETSLAAMMRGEPVEMKLEGDILDGLPLEPYDPAVRLRHTFVSASPAVKARLYVTAHGMYEVKINGKPVTDSLLNPGFTTYDKRLKYQVYNVDGLICPGQNAIAATVADGWYKGKIALGRGCEYGEVPGLLLQLELTGPDGTQQIVSSSEDWKYSFDGPVRTADLFLGEVFDARMDDGDPSLPGYDDSA